MIPTDRCFHIVYAADHNYMLYCCVSIYSLLEHFPAGSPVCVHLLLNESISSRDVALLDVLSDRFPGILFKRHLIPEELFRERDFSDSLWSKAACYRLLLPELLFDIDVCLYLDSDTLIVGDLTSLFQIDLTDTYLAGVFEDIAPVREQTVGREIPGTDTYINSGVLLMNLRKMRSDRIRDQLYAGISRYLVVDQDLLNVCCYGHIRLLPQEYNCIPGVYVKEPRIYHFLMRDYLRPWKNRRAAGSDLWWKYAEHFREAIDLDALRAEADWFQRGSITWLFRRCADYEKVYVVGSGLDAQRIFRALRLGKCHSLKGIVREEDALAYGADILVIAATRRKKIPALKPFLEQKDADRQVICYERRPVSFYNLLPPECSKEVYGELVQWEYGVDGRQVLVPSALLEINAARCPDAEASVRYKNGVRMSTTFREENRQANRIADLLVKAGRRRERVLAGDAAAPEPFAVFSGILKAGCVAVFPGSLNSEGEGLSDPKDAALCGPKGEGRSGPKDAALRDPEKAAAVRYADIAKELSGVPGEALSDKSPLTEALPDDPAVVIDGQRYTNRELMGEAELLRRRTGWNRNDKILLAGVDPMTRIACRIAALYTGSATVEAEGLSPAEIPGVMKREGCTIAALGRKELEQLLEFLEGMKRTGGKEEAAFGSLGCCRMLLVREISEALRMRWKTILPYIPVNGQGYQEQFRYDCEWFMQ